jgi:hypothetical protein
LILNGKRRIDLLPLINPPPSSRFRECPAARATWGDVCSLARRISSFKNWGACMKPDPIFLSLVGGVVWCPVFVCPSSCNLYAWEIMVRQAFFGKSWHKMVF